jgi:hypothetical protein
MSKPMPPAFERSRTMKQEIKDLYDLWLKKTEGNAELHDELSAIEGKEDEISDRFYRALEFGTGGLRGVLGAGTNRMNVFTVNHYLSKFTICLFYPAHKFIVLPSVFYASCVV